MEEAQTDEELDVVEKNVDALESERAEFEEQKKNLEKEISDLEVELDQLNSKEPTARAAEENKSEKKREGVGQMRTGEERERMVALVQRDEVKEFLVRTRELMSNQRSVTGAELSIPEVMLDLLRDNLHRYSKLIAKVRLKPVKGKSRQNISGTIPEGVWTEAVGKLNELTMSFNQIEVDGYKVGGFIPIPNSTLQDSDLNLANEIMDALGQAIGIAIDKAIIYGTGLKMPTGIATRLAQIVEPSNWSQNAPEWENLSVSNLKKIDTTGMTAEEFFAELMLSLGIAEPNYSVGGTFWAMNRKTKMKLMSKAINFNAAGAIVASQMGTMPVEGGEIVELDFIPEGDIVGGYGNLYLLAERAGSQLAASEHVRFIEDQTVFKGTARYDGTPAIGKGFVIVNIENQNPTTSTTFPQDEANTPEV
jgi:HK97 family phage major capsid protein